MRSGRATVFAFLVTLAAAGGGCSTSMTVCAYGSVLVGDRCVPVAPSDAGPHDAGSRDAGSRDAARPDAGPVDAAARDSGGGDAAAIDSGGADAGTGIGSPAPCLGGGNVLYLNGDAADYIHAGPVTITMGPFTSMMDTTSGPHLNVHVEPTLPSDGAWWDVDLATPSGAPFAVGVYGGATRWPFEAASEPGLDVGGDGRGCNMLMGAYEIQTIRTDATGLVELTATFVQHCENGVPALRGCVHYAR